MRALLMAGAAVKPDMQVHRVRSLLKQPGHTCRVLQSHLLHIISYNALVPHQSPACGRGVSCGAPECWRATWAAT